MTKYKIKALIKSDAIFGSGASNGYIHEDGIYDGNGFSYYNAKTLKGVLRKNAEILKNAGIINVEYINKLFGIEGSINTENTGVLMISNLEVDENLKQMLTGKNKIAKEEILNAMTNIQSFIKIEDNGTTKDGALRNIRTVKSEMIFFSEINGLEECDKENFKKILGITKHIGKNVSSGRGEVKLTLEEVNK